MEIINTSERKKILLADDSATIRKVIELTFADEGIDVHSVADGDAAMKKFVEIEPDLVLADVNMPGMSGYQICEMIKQDETTSNIPVILLTGSFEPFDVGEASRVGCNSYFTKPFTSIRELVLRVKEYLELGAFDNAWPESVDIDDLYHRSLVDGVTPDDDAVAEVLTVDTDEVATQEDEPDSDELVKLHKQLLDFDPDDVRTIKGSAEFGQIVEPETASSEAIEIPQMPDGEWTDPAESETELVDEAEIHQTVPQSLIHDTDPLAMSEIELTGDDSQSDGEMDPSTEVPSAAIDLGDTGMDDEMIDTVQVGMADEPRPDADVPVAPLDRNVSHLSLIDPFETPADEFEGAQTAVADGLETTDERSDEIAPVFPAGATAVRFAIEEDTNDLTSPVANGSGMSESEISDALIEKIADRVIAKLSDSVVREVALDAVPKIAEKLIREALEGNQRK
ncbi:MAG: response regulator [Pyrinomonadaceae bacterium]|nr:response regulator [Pyrinomonadaceae bacterium]